MTAKSFMQIANATNWAQGSPERREKNYCNFVIIIFFIYRLKSLAMGYAIRIYNFFSTPRNRVGGGGLKLVKFESER